MRNRELKQQITWLELQPTALDNWIYAAGVAVHQLPLRLRRFAAPIYDRATRGNSFVKETLILSFAPSPWGLGALTRPLRTRQEQEEIAENELLTQTRLSAFEANNHPPDIPQIPQRLAWLPSHSLRKITAYYNPREQHISYGLPPWLYGQDKRRLDPHTWGMKPNFDMQILNRLRIGDRLSYRILNLFGDSLIRERSQPYTQTVQGELYKIFSKLITEPVPPREQSILDRLRFLGFNSEQEFIEKTEDHLIERIRNRCQEIGVDSTSYIARLKEFINFAKAANKVREVDKEKGKAPELCGKRKTGESYYCHLLGSAWLLWTAIEAEITDPQSLDEAFEDTALEFVHDDQEDLPIHMKTDYLEDGTPTYQLSIQQKYLSEFDEQTIETLEKGITLSHDQGVILDSLTKNGAPWLEKVRNVIDPREKTTDRHQKLQKRAARIKIIGDRFQNLMTINEGTDSYLDAIRKYNESINAGWQLLMMTQIADKGAIEAIDHLNDLYRQDRFIALLGAVPLIAQVEKQLLLIQFGEEFARRVKESEHPALMRFNEHLAEAEAFDPDLVATVDTRSQREKQPWQEELLRIIDRELIKTGDEDQSWKIPYWVKRLCHLAACYQPPAELLDVAFPAVRLPEFIGLAHFISDDKFDHIARPIEFNDFVPYINDLTMLSRATTVGYGIPPGGTGDIVFPHSKKPSELSLLKQHLTKMRRS